MSVKEVFQLNTEMRSQYEKEQNDVSVCHPDIAQLLNDMPNYIPYQYTIGELGNLRWE